MDDWKDILDSALFEENGYVSWEEYMRLSVSSEGIIYPMYAYDEKYILEPLLVGFVFIPSPPMMMTTEFGDVIDEVMPIFFDHDNVMMFDEYIDYVYQFEEPETWETDCELLLYHNRAAVFDEFLQEEVDEFGISEVLLAALRGQYNGRTNWATHPDEC